MIHRGRHFGKAPASASLTSQRALVGLHGRTAKPLSIKPEVFICGGTGAFSVTALPSSLSAGLVIGNTDAMSRRSGEERHALEH